MKEIFFEKVLTNVRGYSIVCIVFSTTYIEDDMHEWLSGGVSPCQGEGRGFESRLVLFFYPGEYRGFLFDKIAVRTYNINILSKTVGE